MRRRWFFLFWFCVALIGCHRLLGPFTYYSDPIHGRVIDEETGQPLPGVVVLADWTMVGYGGDAVLHTAETMTDKNGAYTIPAMPRKIRRPFKWLDYRDPELWLYKPGYSCLWRANNDAYITPISPVGVDVVTTTLSDGRVITDGSYSSASKRFSYWNGKVIPLTRPHSLEAEIRVWEFANFVPGAVGVTPPKAPLWWHALAEEYRQRPKGENNSWGNPQEDIDYWREKNK
jgi:hypothetical protein